MKSSDSFFHSLTEFAYLLLILAILIIVFLINHVKYQTERISIIETELNSTKKELYDTRDSLQTLQAILKKKSTIKKRCYEIDSTLIPNYLAIVNILDKNLFLIENKKYNLNQIRLKFKKELDYSEKCNCSLFIQIRSSTSDYEKYFAGKKRLNQYFLIYEL